MSEYGPDEYTLSNGDLLRIVPFEVWHAEALAEDSLEGVLKPAPVRERAEFYLKMGPAYSGWIDGKLIGCAGIMIMWPGVGEAWIIFSEDVLQYKKDAYVVILDYLRAIISKLHLRRIQAHCHSALPHGQKYLEQLGFECEGKLKKYGIDGADHYLYAMITGD